MKKMKKNLLNLLLLFLFSIPSTAQSPTIGLLHSSANATEGYTLFTPLRNNDVYLINNCGEEVNKWTFGERPGMSCYLLENGNLLRIGRENLEIRDWDNNLVWTYATTANGYLFHHDVEPLPNGNILCIVSEIFDSAQYTIFGRNPAITDATFKTDKIIEIQPVGSNDMNIVWEWRMIDHIIQDYDDTKANYGVVADHPELIDINFNNGEAFNFCHVNAIDYNPVLDQILISARNLSEIYIIDHSTSTIEASGHTGGNFNKGGDILWRWGNPQIYRQGNVNDQKLFAQHDSKWIDSNYQDGGKITVFNNGGSISNSFSSIHILNPEINNNSYSLINNVFAPLTYEWTWNGNILGLIVNESKQSGTHGLPNGNFMICETSRGRISEINRNGDLLWSYISPSIDNGVIVSQFSTIAENVNGMFRGEKYLSNYPGFLNKDLTPSGIIENVNSNSQVCITNLNTDNFDSSSITIINPIYDNLIVFNQKINCDKISVYDINGRLIKEVNNFNNNTLELNVVAGIYFIDIQNEYKTFKIKFIVK